MINIKLKNKLCCDEYDWGKAILFFMRQFKVKKYILIERIDKIKLGGRRIHQIVFDDAMTDFFLFTKPA